jgi:hypothetical protein
VSDPVTKLEHAIASGEYDFALEVARNAIREDGDVGYTAYLGLHAANRLGSSDRVWMAEVLERCLSGSPNPSPHHLDELVRAWHESGFGHRAVSACQRMFEQGVFPVSVPGAVIHGIARAGIKPQAIHELLSTAPLEASSETLLLELLRDYDVDLSIKDALLRSEARVVRSIKRGLVAGRSGADFRLLREASWIPIDNPFRGELINGAAFVRTNPMGYAVFHDAIVTGGSSAVDIPDGSTYCEFLDDCRWTEVSSWPDSRVVLATREFVVLEPAESTPTVLPSAVVLTGPMMNEFGHLLADTLPRLEVLDDLDPRIPLVVTSGGGYAREWYSRLIGDRPLIELPPGRSLMLQDAYLPVGRIPIPPHLRRWEWYDPSLSMPTAEGARFLRSRLLRQRAGSSDLPRRFILDRRGHSQHSMSNEQALHEVGGRFGLTSMDPATLSVPEQIALFTQAEQIVGNYGSAFLNLQWSDCGARALGVVPPALVPWAVGQSTYLQACSASLELISGSGGVADAIHGSFEADLQEVSRWLES